MAHAEKGDPLKKQKDSLSFKNKTVQFWKSAATEMVGGLAAMSPKTKKKKMPKFKMDK